MMSRIGRHLREGLRNVLRNGWMTFASVSAVMVTLAVLGISLIIATNAQQLSNSVANQVEFSANLDQSVTNQQAVSIAQQIRSMSDVASVQIITQAEGMTILKKELGSQYNDILNGFKSNPLPIQLVVKAADTRHTDQVAAQVSHVPHVANIKTAGVMPSLFKTLDILRDVGIAFILALLVTSMFLISNTIRITIFSRRREIEIMKLVGATNWFIRWPFIIEGMFIGFFGAIIPLAILGYGYSALYAHVNGTFAGLTFPLVQAGTLTLKLAVIMVGIGIFIGIWGGVMSVRKFLRV
jgi:cell division transport system permease protein